MGLLSQLVESQHLVTISPKQMVQEAAQAMSKNKIGSVVVMEEGEIIGIFSERDLLNRVTSQGKDNKTTPISAVMTKEVSTVSLSTSVEQCYQKMQEAKCRHLPIVDGNKVIGMVTMRNILEWLVKEMKDENVQLKRYIQS